MTDANKNWVVGQKVVLWLTALYQTVIFLRENVYVYVSRMFVGFYLCFFPCMFYHLGPTITKGHGWHWPKQIFRITARIAIVMDC